MPKPSEAIMAFMEKYGIDSDEIWPVPGGKSYAIMHKALSRVAREKGIVMTVNAIEPLCDLEKGIAAVKAFGKMGDAFCESLGEASPKNNRNQYPLAMAQKRAEDRVILGLLSIYGDVYSEEEGEDLKKKSGFAPDGYLDDGEVIPDEHLIKREDGIEVLTVDAQRPIFSQLEREMLGCSTVEECKRWKVSARSRASRLSETWRNDLNQRYLAHLRSLEKQDADEYQERMAG